MRQKEITYPLENKFDYNKGQAQTLLLKSPSRDCFCTARKLQQKVMQAIADIDKSKSQDLPKSNDQDEEAVTGDSILAVLMMSRNVDYQQFSDDIETLLMSGCALVNGVDKFEEGYFGKIGFEESNAIVGVYLGNFLLPSVILKASKS